MGCLAGREGASACGRGQINQQRSSAAVQKQASGFLPGLELSVTEPLSAAQKHRAQSRPCPLHRARPGAVGSTRALPRPGTAAASLGAELLESRRRHVQVAEQGGTSCCLAPAG